MTKLERLREELKSMQAHLELAHNFSVIEKLDVDKSFRKMILHRKKEAERIALNIDINLTPDRLTLAYGMSQKVYKEYSDLLALLDEPEKREERIIKAMSEIEDEIKRLEKLSAKSGQY